MTSTTYPPVTQLGIGVIVPADMALDRELWRWVPDDVSLFVTRLPPAPAAVTIDSVSMIGDPDVVVSTVAELSTVQPAATLYACTSGSFVRGLDGERALVRALEAVGAPHVVTTSGALLCGLRHLNATAVAIATPYDAVITARLAAFLGEAGIDVVASRQLGLQRDIWRVPYEQTVELVRAADHPDADAIVVSCTNLPTYDIIAGLEAEIGKPVVTANQASMWAVLGMIGREASGPGQRLVEAAPLQPGGTP